MHGCMGMGVWVWVYGYGCMGTGVCVWVWVYGYGCMGMGVGVWVWVCGYGCMGVWVWGMGLYTHVVISSPQASIQRQQSTTEEAPGAKIKKQLSKNQLSKLQEEWDKEIPQVSLLRVVKLNAPEWWIILIGMYRSLHE